MLSAYSFIPIFGTALVVISYVLSRIGWKPLQDRFALQGKFTGTRIGIISAGISNVSYNNSVILKYNEKGLYLNPIIPFRMFHKPLFIPWQEIKEVRTRDILIFRLRELIVGNPYAGTITLRRNIYNRIRNYIPVDNSSL